MLPQNEFDEANRVIDGGEMNERFNVTIRWHESHYDGCPYLCGTAAQIAVPQAPARPSHIELGDPEAPRVPGPAPLKKMPEMAAVNKIVGPVPPPPLPPAPPPAAVTETTTTAVAETTTAAVAQSNGHDSGVSLAQRLQRAERSTELFAPRGQHCSTT